MSRIPLLRSLMAERGIDLLLIAGTKDIFYLSGFRGSRGICLVTPDRACLIVDFRYILQASIQAPEWEIIHGSGSLWPDAAALASDMPSYAIHFEPQGMSYADYRAAAEALVPHELLPADALFSSMRQMKDEAEIARIGAAQRIAEEGWLHAVGSFAPGSREMELAAAIDDAMRRSGATAPAFPTIVAAGEMSAMPHAEAGERTLSEGDAVLVDWGACCRGYNSDTTRAFFVGRVDPKLREIYDIVRDAQQIALEMIGPGLLCREVDAAARDYITRYGYGDSFGHGLGHGVGLDVHERPVLNPASEELLLPGMVVTVEPGIYLPGKGGIRIEDLLVITAEGYTNLTGLSKELIIL